MGSNYWDSASLPTTEGPPFVRIPGQPGLVWEYARLSEDLHAGGSAAAKILRLDDEGTLAGTPMRVEVFDHILPSTIYLRYDSVIVIYKPPSLGHWCLGDWTCARA